MGKIILKSKEIEIKQNGVNAKVKILSKEDYDKFNPDLLGLENISAPSSQVEAIAAIFDLSGFTKFCSQVDPHLAVPEYLSRFLAWLFMVIKKEFVKKTYVQGKELWAELPFLAKFLGDGVLFLWDTQNMDEESICNVIVSLDNICTKYIEEFYPKIRSVVVSPPTNLRCGIARGTVYSVGNGNDYVGPCINMASRLQKLYSLTFCYSRRGFDINKSMDPSARKYYIEKQVNIRGIGEDELVWVLVEEFKNLSLEEKKLLRDPK
jgi:hypothetical protein